MALWAPIYKPVPVCQEQRWNAQGFYKDTIVLRKISVTYSEKISFLTPRGDQQKC